MGILEGSLSHRDAQMNLKTLTLPLLLIAVAFIGVGDRILPNPLNAMSLNARNSINQALMGLTPKLKPQKPNAKTEKAVDSLSR
jgi:hypothetical protein